MIYFEITIIPAMNKNLTMKVKWKYDKKKSKQLFNLNIFSLLSFTYSINLTMS